MVSSMSLLTEKSVEKQLDWLECRHSSVDSSVLTILTPRVRAPSTSSTLLSFKVFVLYLSCEKIENKQKEAWFVPFFVN